MHTFRLLLTCLVDYAGLHEQMTSKVSYNEQSIAWSLDKSDDSDEKQILAMQKRFRWCWWKIFLAEITMISHSDSAFRARLVRNPGMSGQGALA